MISAYAPIFIAMAFQSGLQHRTSDFKRFICDDLATLLKNVVRFCPVTLEFKRVVDVQPALISLKINL